MKWRRRPNLPGDAALGALYPRSSSAQKWKARTEPRPQSPSPPVAVVGNALGEQPLVPVAILASSPYSRLFVAARGRRRAVAVGSD